MLICDKCNAQILEGAKFCPQCADPVTDADRISAPSTHTSIPTAVIEFGYSTSANYERAVDLCQNLPSYAATGEGKKVHHRVTLALSEVELLITIFDLVGSWKSSSMTIDGHRASKSDLVYHGPGCYRERQKTHSPKQFCFGIDEWDFNIWGCKKLGLPLAEYAQWLEYGKFDESGVWHLDKNQIKKELQEALRKNQHCPILNSRRVMETWDKLPDTISPKSDAAWEYQTSYEQVNGEYRDVATGVRPVLKAANRYILGDFQPKTEFHTEQSESNTRTINVKVTTAPEKKPTGKRNRSFFRKLLGL